MSQKDTLQSQEIGNVKIQLLMMERFAIAIVGILILVIEPFFNQDCLNRTMKIEGCSAIDGQILSYCNRNAECVYNVKENGIPENWNCPAEFYGTKDGCDCECGVVDPDCIGNNECHCNGEIEITSIQGTIVIYSIFVSTFFLTSFKFFSEYCGICLKKILKRD
jgi:hypothetical protein